MFEVHLTGWYWTPENELRQCIVLKVWDDMSVVDSETLEPVQVAPSDVLVEKPEST